MPINQNCPIARKPFLVPDNGAGKKVQCPHCGKIYVVGTAPGHPTDLPTAAFAPALKPAPSAPPAAAPAETRHASSGARRPMAGMVIAASMLLLLGVGAVLLVRSLMGSSDANPQPGIAQAKDGQPADDPRGADVKNEDKKPAEIQARPKQPAPINSKSEPPALPKDLPLPTPLEDDDTLLVRLQIESIDKVLENIRYLTKAAQKVEMYDDVMKSAIAMLPFKGGTGIDLTKPLGAYVQVRAKAGVFRPVIMVPIRDQAKFLDFSDRPVKPQDDGNYHVMIPDIKAKVILRIAHGYAYLTFGDDYATDDADLLKPSQVFALPGPPLIAAVFRIDRVPEKLRGEVLGKLKNVAELVKQLGLAAPNKNGPAFTEKLLDSLIGLGVDVLDGGKDASLSLEISPKSNELALQVRLDAAPDTYLAATIKSIGAMTSTMGELADGDAAFRFLCHLRMTESLRRLWAPLAREITDKVLQDDSDPVALKEFKRIITALQPTIEAAEIDVGMTLRSEDAGNSSVVVGGIKAPSSAKLQLVLRQQVSELPDPKDQGNYQWDTYRSDSVGIHRLDVGKLMPPPLRPFFDGDGILMAFRPDSVLWAVGPNSKPAMEHLIRSGPKQAPPLLLELNVRELIKILPLAEQGRERASARKHLTDAHPGRVRLSLEGGSALRLRLSLDLPLLALAMESASVQASVKKMSP